MLVVGIVVGWLGTMPQSGDWDKHNAVLRDLIDYPWPVYYRDVNGGPVMLSYYIGQYLLPAAVGKLTHSFVLACVTQYLWLCLGLLLLVIWVLLLVRARSARQSAAAVAALLLFNCCLYLSQGLTQALGIAQDTAWNAFHWYAVADNHLQYRSFFVMMRWVPQQSLVSL